MPALSRSNLHLDILMGRDEIVDITDVVDGTSGVLNVELTNWPEFVDADKAQPLDIHAQMEKKLRM